MADLPDLTETALSRRRFLRTTAAATAVPSLTALSSAASLGQSAIRVGLIGCGGRGTGAAANALEASEHTVVVAMADVFRDRLDDSLNRLRGYDGARVQVRDTDCYVGFNAYRELLDQANVDLVILATPPHFRPMHFEAAVNAGVHVFMEKPVAVDPAGIRKVLAASDEADRRHLCVVAGTQRRHEASYRAALDRVQDGAIGRIVSARCAWNMGGLWVKKQAPEWTDMEWQVRNWLYFTWLSGDHIVEQHVHNLDVVNWAMGTHPTRAVGLGGRQVRTGAEYGHIFDHFAIEYEYPEDVFCFSLCRQIDGTDGRVDESIHGTDGVAFVRPGAAEIRGANPWRFEDANPNPYVQEHRHLIAAMTSGSRGAHLNEARTVAESTLTAIMGRMSAYTGKAVTWEQALNSELDLSPAAYEFGPLPKTGVAMPGRTPLV